MDFANPFECKSVGESAGFKDIADLRVVTGEVFCGNVGLHRGPGPGRKNFTCDPIPGPNNQSGYIHWPLFFLVDKRSDGRH